MVSDNIDEIFNSFVSQINAIIEEAKNDTQNNDASNSICFARQDINLDVIKKVSNGEYVLSIGGGRNRVL